MKVKGYEGEVFSTYIYLFLFILLIVFLYSFFFFVCLNFYKFKYFTIFSEALAKRLTIENIHMPPECIGKMTGNECQMEFDASNRNFTANFS